MMTGYHIVFDPILPNWIVMTFAVMALTLFALAARSSLRKASCRLGFALLLLIFLLQPQLSEEKRKPLNDVALIAIDKSLSGDFGKRSETSVRTLAHLQEELKKLPNLEVRTIDVAQNASDETRVFDEIEPALSDVPNAQRAGVILLSDGQIADTPSQEILKSSPFHLVLTGDKKDKDREIKIINAPGYSVLGETVLLKFRIEDHNIASSGTTTVTLNLPDGTIQNREVMIGQDQDWPLPVALAGQNVFEISVEAQKDEISTLNNRVVVNIQGVRNRLHVLLVSGEPYPGARMWRDLLKADPGIDLVHFTILRSPDKVDMTPPNELSLIAFPFQELFERKLKDFDLIIMDRFSLNRILPDYYFMNMKNYVLNGGALLEINGPSYATDTSLYRTSLGAVLPGAPNGSMMQSSFKPEITALGKTHPVTMPLNGAADWGPWLQQVPVSATTGDVLMTGINNNPLLILSHEGEGRVAQMTSDQIWLWARGYQGGGPTTELLRRIVHWLMKEPELDENALIVKEDGKAIDVRTRDLKNNAPLQVTKPDGSTEKLSLTPDKDGWLTGNLQNTKHGIYKISDGTRQKIIALGDQSTPEFLNIITTDKIMAPFVKQSGGTTIWASEEPGFQVKTLQAQRRYGGSDWVGLKRNNASSLISSELKPLCPPELMSFLGLIAGLLLWWNESRRAARKTLEE